jgi:hypothetical protein
MYMIATPCIAIDAAPPAHTLLEAGRTSTVIVTAGAANRVRVRIVGSAAGRASVITIAVDTTPARTVLGAADRAKIVTVTTSVAAFRARTLLGGLGGVRRASAARHSREAAPARFLAMASRNQRRRQHCSSSNA